MSLIKKYKFNKQKEITILNIPLCHYGERNENGVVEKYFELFPKSYFKKIMKIIYENLDKKYDFVFICRVNAVGENYLLNYLFQEVAEINNAKKYCFIVFNQKNYIPVFKMFSNVHVINCIVDRVILNTALNKRKFTYKGIKFQVFQCTLDEINYLFREKYAKQDYQIPYPEQIRIWAGVSKFRYLPMVFTENDKNIINKFQNVNLKNFIFLSSEAKSVLPLSENFWNRLKTALREHGYDIIENSKTITYPQAVYIASQARYIIALRSGITEIFSTLNVPQHIIYTKHRFSPISTRKTREVHSLKNYPFVNQEIIYEYEYNNNDEDLIRQIIERV